MSVLIEAMSLVIPRHVLDVSYPGGTDAYTRDALAADVQFRYCVSDDRLTVMSFFDPEAAEPWLLRLQEHGIVHTDDHHHAVETVIVDQRFGPANPCAWLEWRQHKQGFTYAWLAGTEPGDMAAPVDWTPEQSRRLVRTDIRDEPGRMLQLADDDGLETWLDFQTGHLLTGLAHRDPATAPIATSDSPATSCTPEPPVPTHDSAAPLLPIVTAALAERDLRYLALGEGSIGLPIRTDLATYDCRIDVDDALRTVSCYTTLGARVPAERRLAAAEAITRANYGLRIGCFELDMRDGELRFRTSVDVEGGELTTGMFHALLAAAVNTADRYNAALMRVSFAGAEPAAAIAEAEAT